MQYLHLQLYCMQVISPVLKRPATKVDPGGKRVRGASTSSTAVETAFPRCHAPVCRAGDQ
jgi:hypothetical protein